MLPQSDTELITAVVRHDNRRAFGSLVERYQTAIRRFFLHQTCGNAALSDDLAQETFLKAFTSIRQFRGDSQFSTWLFRIAYNVHYDHLRRQHAECELDDVRINATSSPVAAGISMDIYKALAILSERERLCVTLQLVDGYSIDEISNITNLPQGTVKSHLFRGKEKLTTYLKNNGYDKRR